MKKSRNAITTLAVDISNANIPMNIETGDRVVPDYELSYFSEALNAPVTTLLSIENVDSHVEEP